MLEDIVLLETKKNNPNLSFQAEFQFGEIDMVIYDKSTDSCKLYEIKHSTEIHKDQYRHLINTEFISKIESKYGNVTNRIVLYKGKNNIVDNIEYMNIEEYLLGM